MPEPPIIGLMRIIQLLAIALLVAACGGAGDTATTLAVSSTTAAPVTTDTASTSSTIAVTTATTTTTQPAPATTSTTSSTTTTSTTTTTTSTTTTTTTVAPTTTTTAAPTTTTSVDYVAWGSDLATDKGCRNCHSTDGSVGLGPSWAGLAGSTVTLADGSTVTATSGYIRESIVSPDARIVDGFTPGMMRVVSLSSDEIDALVAYIASR